MSKTSIKGRLLAIAAGAAFAVGGLTILLDKELIHPDAWAASQWLTILTVFGTIAAGHLMADAGRARHAFAMLGFFVLFMSGTGLVVYNSVGRQAETTGTTVLSVEDTNQKIVEKSSDLEAAKARKTYADAQVQREMTGQRCGPRCRDWKQNSKDVAIVIKQLEDDIAKLGPQKPVNAQAAAMADLGLLVGIPASKDQIVAALTLLIPFLKTLFFEIGSIVSLGFAFRSSPSISKQKSFSEIKEEALKNVEPSPLVTMFSGELPDPTPPKPKKRLPKNVIEFPAPIAGNHPVIEALEGNGGSVASNQELAKLMGVCEAESSKRVQEVQNRLTVSRVGKEKRIALKA